MHKKRFIPITNAIMFAKVMSNKDVCKKVLETLLEIEIDYLEDVKIEHTFDIPDEAKGVRFDVFVKNQNCIFDIEMQMVNNGELPLRARYYQSICDISTLKKGDSYLKLKQSYIIFLCNFDLIGDGKVCYVVESACNGVVTPKYNDKVKKLFFDFSKFADCANIETSALLEFFATSNASSNLTKQLNDLVFENNGNETWRKAMTFDIFIEDCKYAAHEEGFQAGVQEGRVAGLQEGREAGLQEGLKEGREVGLQEGLKEGRYAEQIKSAKIMLQKGLDFDFISEITGLAIEEIANLEKP